MFPTESNVLKIHRRFPALNSRRLREAIVLTLFDIKDKCSGNVSGTGKFRNEENERLEKALLMLFDPYTNENVMNVLSQQLKTNTFTPEMLKKYYKVPCMCLLRI